MSRSPDQSNGLPAWILVLLAALGVTPTVYFALITQNPWLFVLYAVFIVILYIVKLLWPEFRPSFVKAVAGYIWTGIYFPSRWIYQKRYCNHLRKVYGFDEVRWLSSSGLEESRQLKLEQIFIESAIDLKVPSKKIQYYLASERYSKPLVLLGEVGIGKSTLLHYIALSLVDRKKRLEWKVSYELPFYLSLGLGAFIDKLKENRELPLAEALEVAMRDKGWPQAPPEWIERRLKKGHCLILLDGLDEVADAGIRQQVVTWIQRQIDSDNEHGFVITSRPLSYRENPLERVFVRHIQRFTPEQIDTFIKKWYEATSSNLLKAEELKNQLHETSYNLLELVRNPLLLRMAIIVHQYRGTLPQSRVELYKDIFEVYLRERAYAGGRWRWIEAPHDNSVLSTGKRQEILQTLAYKMMEREITQIESSDAVDLIKAHFENMPITPEQFLQSVRHNGILGPFPSPFYGFAHRSFQEYLAARYVKDCQQPDLLVKHRNPEKLDWWRETIVLYGAQADPTPLMEACLKEESLLGDAFDLALILMEPEVHNNVELLKKSKPEVHGTQMRFERAVSLATEAKDTRYQIANALLKQRKWRLIPEDESSEEEPMKDSSFIKCAEYQLFLDEPEYRTCQPDHWQDDRFPSGQGLEPVLGVRHSDANALCKWLTVQESGAWHYRLPTAKETQDISVGEAGRGYWIDDGNGFCWARGEPLSSSILSQDRLHILWTQDERKPEVNDLANYISFVDKLEDIRRRHHDLVEHLTSIHEHISKHKSNLEGNYINAKKHKKGLDEKIDQVVSRKAVYEHTLKDIAQLRKKLDAVLEKENDLEKKENDLPKKLNRYQAEQIKLLKAKSQRSKSVNLPQRRLASRQRIQPAIRPQARIVNDNPTLNRNKARLAQLEKIIGDLQQQQKRLEEDHKNAKSEESVLLQKLENADEREQSTNQQLERAWSEESKLIKQLEIARKDLDEAEQQLSSFRTLAEKFDAIYSDFSRFTSTHSSNKLARNQILNLDQILVPRENKNALDDISATINRTIQKLTDRLDSFHRESYAAFANINNRSIRSGIGHALANARDLARQFDQITSGEYVQQLDKLLNWYFGELAKNENRSVVRRNPHVRLLIRFLAKALAEHLSYWLQKELFSYVDPSSDSQSASRHYFDVYIAFAILEERINGNLSANEGILIVRERTRENHETT